MNRTRFLHLFHFYSNANEKGVEVEGMGEMEKMGAVLMDIRERMWSRSTLTCSSGTRVLISPKSRTEGLVCSATQ